MTAHEWAETLKSKAATHAPTIQDGETLVLDLPGRVIGNTDHTSHWFRVTGKNRQTLHVRHGMGDESHALHGAPFTAGMDADEAYRIAVAIHFASKDAARCARGAAVAEYRTAFAEGRLKKRKVRNQNATKVWIEPGVLE